VGATIPLEIVIVILAVVLPAELDASMVNVLASSAEKGVPDMAQVVGLRESPPGRVGVDVHNVGAVPEIEGVIVVMALFTVNVGIAL
jgi:hypothetical protein